MERAQLEQNIQDSKERMEKLEGYWMEAQSLCKVMCVLEETCDARRLVGSYGAQNYLYSFTDGVFCAFRLWTNT